MNNVNKIKKSFLKNQNAYELSISKVKKLKMN